MREEILAQLEKIFRNIFDDEELEITEETNPEDIEDWDSIGHVYLITEVEDSFGIDLTDEANELDVVSKFIDVIMSKRN